MAWVTLPPMPDKTTLDSELSKNLAAVRDSIGLSAALSGRSSAQINLLAVSKGQPAESIAALQRLGLADFGENYAQELFAKQEKLQDLPIRWHFIGHLQSNKIDRLVQISSCIQSVSDLRHARLIGASAQKYNKAPFPIYIQVNPDNEKGKGGVPLSECPRFYQQLVAEVPTVIVTGIMAVPPSDYQDLNFKGKPLPESYLRLQGLAAVIGQGGLSLGMSGDLDMAIRAGSTCVRIGRALLGARSAPAPSV